VLSDARDGEAPRSVAESYDAIVLGLGAMGSATLYHLARRGVRVLGLEQFAPGHTMGSSHGDSRIIRELYFEHPLYVPLVQRAYELWEALERDAGEELLRYTGGLMVGSPESALVRGARRSAESHGISYELLTHAQIRSRCPAFDPPDDYVAVWDARAGFLRPEACNQTHVRLAVQEGAQVRYEEPVTSWKTDGEGVRVITAHEEYRAARLVVCVGAWTKSFMSELDLPLQVERQVLTWFDVPASRAWYEPERFPVFLCEFEEGHQIYGFPRLQRGVKTAIFHEGALSVTPEAVARAVTTADIEALRGRLARILPELAVASVRETVTCLFTNTPDGHFVVDFHPAHPQVLLSSPCSGHGFKFASALGEMQADLLLNGRTRFDLQPFSLSRFVRQSGAGP